MPRAQTATGCDARVSGRVRARAQAACARAIAGHARCIGAARHMQARHSRSSVRDTADSWALHTRTRASSGHAILRSQSLQHGRARSVCVVVRRPTSTRERRGQCRLNARTSAACACSSPLETATRASRLARGDGAIRACYRARSHRARRSRTRLLDRVNRVDSQTCSAVCLSRHAAGVCACVRKRDGSLRCRRRAGRNIVRTRS